MQVERLAILPGGAAWVLLDLCSIDEHQMDTAVPAVLDKLLSPGIYEVRPGGETVTMLWPAWKHLALRRITPAPVPIVLRRDDGVTQVGFNQDGRVHELIAPGHLPFEKATMYLQPPERAKNLVRCYTCAYDNWSLLHNYTGDRIVFLSPATWCFAWPQQPKRFWLEVEE